MRYRDFVLVLFLFSSLFPAHFLPSLKLASLEEEDKSVNEEEAKLSVSVRAHKYSHKPVAAYESRMIERMSL